MLSTSPEASLLLFYFIQSPLVIRSFSHWSVHLDFHRPTERKSTRQVNRDKAEKRREECVEKKLTILNFSHNLAWILCTSELYFNVSGERERKVEEYRWIAIFESFFCFPQLESWTKKASHVLPWLSCRWVEKCLMNVGLKYTQCTSERWCWWYSTPLFFIFRYDEFRRVEFIVSFSRWIYGTFPWIMMRYPNSISLRLLRERVKWVEIQTFDNAIDSNSDGNFRNFTEKSVGEVGRKKVVVRQWERKKFKW